MTTFTDQQIAANYMGALAHLLGGQPGRHQEFIDKVELILSSNEPHAMQLMQFTSRVRQTGRPVLWIHVSAKAPNVPQIGLVAMAGDQVYTIENCMLWTSPNGKGTHLIPDNFKMGSFKFDGELRLKHLPKAPEPSFLAAQAGMSRAYLGLRRIEADQRKRGDVFAVPELAKAA